MKTSRAYNYISEPRRIRQAVSNKDRYMSDLIIGAREIREDIKKLYKDFLKVGKKVKYIEPVGSLVSDAVNELLEAEMAIKAVVDAGNEWISYRTESMEEIDEY